MVSGIVNNKFVVACFIVYYTVTINSYSKRNQSTTKDFRFSSEIYIILLTRQLPIRWHRVELSSAQLSSWTTISEATAMPVNYQHVSSLRAFTHHSLMLSTIRVQCTVAHSTHLPIDLSLNVRSLLRISISNLSSRILHQNWAAIISMKVAMQFTLANWLTVTFHLSLFLNEISKELNINTTIIRRVTRLHNAISLKTRTP